MYAPNFFGFFLLMRPAAAEYLFEKRMLSKKILQQFAFVCLIFEP
jgi:hypothetical protein